jgi:hypothetical protein
MKCAEWNYLSVLEVQFGGVMTSEEEEFNCDGESDQIKLDRLAVTQKRSLVVAYLSYALEDVRAFCPTSLYLLQMTINTLKQDGGSTHSVQ